MIKINLGLDNQALYDGCEVVEVNSQLRLAIAPNIVEIVDSNVTKIIDSVPIDQRSKITLTGSVEIGYSLANIQRIRQTRTFKYNINIKATHIWPYLLVFERVIKDFKTVYYDDGRSQIVLKSE